MIFDFNIQQKFNINENSIFNRNIASYKNSIFNKDIVSNKNSIFK